jgi:hypothetical protein
MDACTSPSGATACACEAETWPNLLAHWALDEGSGHSAAEATGNAPNGTLQNFSDGAWVAGRSGSALRFDGVDDAVHVGAVAGELKTLSLWLHPETTQARTSRTPMQLPLSHGPLDQWTTPQNAYADDGLWATAASLIGTQAQHWGGFQLARQLPEGATIQGITVSVDTGNLGVLGAVGVELSWDGGTTHTDSRYGWGQLIISSNLRQAGGPDKLWGRVWSVADFAETSFRVRATFGGIANAMSLDYLGVEVDYTERVSPRGICALSPQTGVAFSELDATTVASAGWPESVIYVNGVRDGALGADWSHVVITGPAAIAASDVQFGATSQVEHLSVPYDGLLDDVRMLSDELTPAQIALLAEQARCAP